MIELIYAPSFVRVFKKVEPNLQNEILEKIALFKDSKNHKQLKVHKLHGSLKNCYSFSVNYNIRIIFSYGERDQINILSLGDHDVYR